MRSHLKLTIAATVLSISIFGNARANRISTDSISPVLHAVTNEQPLLVPQNLTLTEPLNGECDNGGCVFSYVQDMKASAKSVGDLSIERRREDAGRMRLPGFVVSIPEPMTIVLLATGLLGLGGIVRRKV